MAVDQRHGARPPRTPGALLWRAIGRHRGRLIAAAVLFCGWSLSEALVPVLIGLTIDRAVATGDLLALGWGVAAVVVLFVVLSYSYRFAARISFRSAQAEMHALRMEIAGRALDSRGARTELLPGETLSIATGDSELIGMWLREIAFLFALIVTIGFVAVTLLRIEPLIGVVVLTGVPAVLGLVQLATPLIARRTRTQQAAIAHTAGLATDLVRGIRPLQGVGAEDAAAGRYRVESARAREASIGAARSHGYLYGATSALSGVFLALVALVAGRAALDGRISVGELVAVVGLAQFLAEPIRAIGELSARSAASLAAARRIVEALAAGPLVTTGSRTAGDGPLVLEAVASGPLTGFDLALRPGELVAVVIDDPAVADRLAAILAGEVAAEDRRGRVLLGDIPVEELAPGVLRDRVMVCPHHVDLFAGTLRSSIEPGTSLPEGRLRAVLDASAAADIVALHPAGLDQPVEAQGSTLSGGQRQRIALARALAAEPDTLVLHEPTSAVDAVTEHRIAEGLRRLRHSEGSAATTLVLTSSPALLAVADRVLLVREGRLRRTGSHAELLDDPDYRRAVIR